MKMDISSIREILISYFNNFSENNLNDSPSPPSKNEYRLAHANQKIEKLESNHIFLKSKADKLKKYIANGEDIIPKKISPEIEVVRSNTHSADLFRLLSLNWSVPVSEGYGRRMRFIVWDKSNEKVMGIFALGDAVFNLKVRDDFIGWNADARKEKLVNIMDAYILGSAPGYNQLLVGKLIASLIKSEEVVNLFREKYKNSVGLISGNKKNPYLTYITLTSALGRSSVYNRLKLNNDYIFRKIGMTTGWGHFHISNEIFALLVEYLQSIDDSYFQSYGYGSGPNWKIRVIKRAMQLLGVNANLMRHGYLREVYICELARNSSDFIHGKTSLPDYSLLKTVNQQSELALDRWVVPRSERHIDYLNFHKDSFFESLNL